MKQIFLQDTINYMFSLDQKKAQEMFESMGMEPEVKTIQSKEGNELRYYVYNIKDEEANL
jgi:hypothetical protein